MSHASSTITVVAGLIQQGGRLLVCGAGAMVPLRCNGSFPVVRWNLPRRERMACAVSCVRNSALKPTSARKPTVHATTIRGGPRWNCYSITSLTSVVPCTTTPLRRSAGPSRGPALF